MPGRVQLDGGSLQFHSGVEHLGGGEIQGVFASGGGCRVRKSPENREKKAC